jgi:hypothetical protein
MSEFYTVQFNDTLRGNVEVVLGVTVKASEHNAEWNALKALKNAGYPVKSLSLCTVEFSHDEGEDDE